MATTAEQTLARTPVGRKPRDDMDQRRSCEKFGSMDHHVSACSAYKQNMKAISYFLDDVEATDEDHEEYVRGLIMKYGPRCFFCNLEGHFKPDCTQFGMQWRMRNIPVMKRRFQPVEYV